MGDGWFNSLTCPGQTYSTLGGMHTPVIYAQVIPTITTHRGSSPTAHLQVPLSFKLCNKPLLNLPTLRSWFWMRPEKPPKPVWQPPRWHAALPLLHPDVLINNSRKQYTGVTTGESSGE